MALEPFSWYAQAFVLLGLPFLHTEVALVPLAFNEWLRDNTSL